MGRLYSPHGTDAMVKTLRWVIPWSRLLLADRAAIFYSGLPDEASRSLSDRAKSGVSDDGAKSGSPPDRWAYDQPVFLKNDENEPAGQLIAAYPARSQLEFVFMGTGNRSIIFATLIRPMRRNLATLPTSKGD